jgi:hypothetical protein
MTMYLIIERRNEFDLDETLSMITNSVKSVSIGV